jgi:hypothetical protein
MWDWVGLSERDLWEERLALSSCSAVKSSRLILPPTSKLATTVFRNEANFKNPLG